MRSSRTCPTWTSLVPIGGGGLAAGVSTLAKLLNPNVKSSAWSRRGALHEGQPGGRPCGHPPTANTIADGVASRPLATWCSPYIRENVDRVITIPDTELVDAFLDVMEKAQDGGGKRRSAVRGRSAPPVLPGG